MKRLLIIPILLIVCLTVFWSCDPNASDVDVSDIITLSVSGVTFDESAKTADFGTVLVGDSSTLTAKVKNTSPSAITIVSISNSNATDYTVTGAATPFTVESDEEVIFSVAFTPSTNSSLEASITITLDTEGLSETIKIKGAGNYAPSAVFGITVSGAETYTGINGFYTKDIDSYASDNENADDDGRPLYKMTSNRIDYFLYYFQLNTGASYWGINYVEPVFEAPNYDEDHPVGSIAYIDIYYDSYYPPEEDPSGDGYWVENNTANNEITVKIGVTKTETETGSILTANYQFNDPDGDDEGSSIYQWYWGESVDGDYTAISGAESKTYDISKITSSTYLKVSVAPVDSNGFSGVEVTSDPYLVFNFGQFPADY